MADRRIIEVDITDRADGKIPAWNDGDAVHDYVSPLVNPMDAVGQIIYGGASGAATKLAAGSSGQLLKSAGAAAPSWLGPKVQYEVDYAEITSSVNITATAEATPTDVVTGASVAFDGSTVAVLEFYCPTAFPDNTAAGRTLRLAFYDGTTSLGIAMLKGTQVAGTNQNGPVHLSMRYTPSNGSHTFKVAGWVSSGTGNVTAGAGGGGNSRQAFLRVSKLSA